MKTGDTTVNSGPPAALIFANGKIEDLSWVESYLETAAPVIAADGGVRHLLALGKRPDILVGDLDSLPAELASLSGPDVEVLQVPADKDETDLEMALLLARQRYPGSDLLVFGAFGGRLDHTLANVSLLAHPELIGRSVKLVDDRATAWLVGSGSTINGRAGDIVSLLPLGGDVRVAETRGLRWPLIDERLYLGRSRGISNEMMADQAQIKVSDGTLLCVHTRR